jgi:lysophospholipase L1-like esterase
MKIQEMLVVYLGMITMLVSCEGAKHPTLPILPDKTRMQLVSTRPSDDTLGSDIAVVITAVGDSITYGEGSSIGGYPPILEEKLQAAGYNVIVYNEGIGGATSNLVEKYFQRTTKGTDIALIMVGTNDISSPGSCFEPYNCRTIEYIRSMVEKALFSEIVPVLGTVTPTRAGDVYAHFNPAIEALNLEIFTLAAEYNIQVADNYNAILNNGGNVLFSDKHHFNDQGYEIIAEQFYQAIIANTLIRNH